MMVRTALLKGVALDWAVALACGYKPTGSDRLYLADYAGLFTKTPKWGVTVPGHVRISPTTIPNQAWPLIDKHNIVIIGNGEGVFHANLGAQYDLKTQTMDSPNPWVQGPDKLTAAMRCLVARFIGWRVDIPEEVLLAAGVFNVETETANT